MACSAEVVRPEAAKETFLKLYGGSNAQTGEALILTSDDGYLLLGSTNSTDSSNSSDQHPDMYLIKTDAYGDAIWSRRYSRTGAEAAFGKAICPQGDGFLLLGQTDQTGQGGIWIMAVGSEGDRRWDTWLGGDDRNQLASDLLIDENGDIVIVGASQETNSDIYLAKLNQEGDLMWERSMGEEGEDQAVDIEMLPNGQIAVLAQSQSLDSASQDQDLLFFLIDEQGNVLQSQRYGESGREEEAVSIMQHGDGTLFLFGYAIQDDLPYPYLLALSDIAPSAPDWEAIIDISCVPSGLTSGPSGDLVIAGTESTMGDSDYMLIGLDSDGTRIWNEPFRSPGNSTAGNIIAPADSAYAFIGTHAFGTNTMLSLIKTNHRGQLAR